MELLRIIDLVGKDVSGIKVDLRTRLKNGSFRYAGVEPLNPVISMLKTVEFRQEKVGAHKKHRWLYWTWDTRTLNHEMQCGYSGTASDDMNEIYLKREED